ncbi:HEPN domain-containing protein [Ignisphaera sp. 4213-co]|uniref:HEPN domain-containing protein n=1 Tax=Ignisphaera cupida TaxID=3050454 RepID=A0ABD4Z8N8_9CREN|nr:HEPN domain-containing protein [Ignisphaera sp. 4213-co]MDK6028923.1 HEPN domain-containing protein [Ignisphaera sp. 4213-co]
MPIRDEVVNWLEEAKADLRHARNSIGVGDYNWSCFASQQAAEKALKALAIHVLGEYVRGHDIVKLYRRLKQFINQKIDEGLLAKLSAYYTLARYPNAGIERPHEEIDEGQAKEALQIAEVIVNEVSKAIRDP